MKIQAAREEVLRQGIDPDSDLANHRFFLRRNLEHLSPLLSGPYDQAIAILHAEGYETTAQRHRAWIQKKKEKKDLLTKLGAVNSLLDLLAGRLEE